jgi:hypothetical protein
MPTELDQFSTEDFYEEHRELADALQKTDRLLARVDRTQRQVDHQMGRLADLIESHFDHEESGGYMAEVLARAPQLTRTAMKLASEHADLLDDTKKLQMLARSGVESPAWWRQVEQDFHWIKGRLLAHEHAENKLLHEAYNRDIGVTD